MRFATRLTLLFALVLVVFVASTLPVTAALLRGAVGTAEQKADWNRVVTLWSGLDADTKSKAGELMAAVADWKAQSAVPSLESDARYLRFQTTFLMFSTAQAVLLLVLVIVGLRVLMAPVRSMTRVVERLKAGEAARLEERGGAEWMALARQFNSMIEQNQSLNRLQGWQEVASFLSHQIKNPLTSITFAEQNIRQLAPELSSPARDNLDIIGEQAKRINNLVRRLRTLTSFDELSRTDVDLKEWMEHWVSTRRRDEAWEISMAPLGRVSLVPLLWEQALDNLLANSREASKTDPLSVFLSLDVCEGMVVLRWSDSNRVEDEASLRLIGTARYTTKKEGSGLGLFFVRRIAELHGGTLVIEPSSRGGLQFVLTLEGGAYGADSHRR